MEIHFQETDPSESSDRLGFALFLAVAIHSIVIFGIGFKFLERTPAAQSLDVTLAQRPSTEDNSAAMLLAQANQQGSGELVERRDVTTDTASPYDDVVLRDTQPIPLPKPIQQQGQISQQTFITTVSDSHAVASTIADEGREQEDIVDTSQTLPLEAISSLHARLDQQKQAYNQIPKTLRLTSASTKAADHAAYLNYWIEKVEETGNLYYPERARAAELYGDILMVVTVLPDGSVESVDIVKSSGHTLLDLAAIATVRLAAPFAPFPQKMAAWHKMEITRTWRYMPGNRVVTSAQQP